MKEHKDVCKSGGSEVCVCASRTGFGHPSPICAYTRVTACVLPPATCGSDCPWSCSLAPTPSLLAEWRQQVPAGTAASYAKSSAGHLHTNPLSGASGNPLPCTPSDAAQPRRRCWGRIPNSLLLKQLLLLLAFRELLLLPRLPAVRA